MTRLNDSYPDKSQFYRLPWSKNDNPIGWLEVTDTCNITCKGCYRQRLTGHKSLEEIKEEIRLFKKWRNCDNISISGGEPLTHPDIEEVVAYCWELRMKPILLTNAVLLDKDRLKNLKAAGLKGLTIHIDSFQERPHWKGKSEGDLNELRMHFAELLHEVGPFFCSFNSTVYHDTVDSIPVIMKWANQRLDKVHSIIFITYRGMPIRDDLAYLSEDKTVEVEEALSYTESDMDTIDITSINVYNILKEHVPFYDAAGYLGGTATHDAYKWFISVLIGTKDRPIGCFGPKGMEAVQAGHHLFQGTYPAYPLTNKTGRKVFLLSLFDRKIRAAFGRYLKNPANLAHNVYVQSIGIIQAPDLTSIHGQDMCDSCPDITWYDGQMVNSCRMDEYRKFGGFIQFTNKDE